MEGGRSERLPKREGQRPLTYPGIPHKQIGAESAPDVCAELLRSALLLPGVESISVSGSMVGTHALRLCDARPIKHKVIKQFGRNFAYVHTDGSVHLFLPAAQARQAVEKCWAERHTMATCYLGEEAPIMLYTPRSPQEVRIVSQLIFEAYRFVVDVRRTAVKRTMP
jgi:hypothetical protein